VFLRLVFIGLVSLSALCLSHTTVLAADPFTVSGVAVDATGATAIEAQTLAISDGQLRAGQILIDRVTLPGEPPADLMPDDVAKLIRALEISNEKRSGNRYLGNITVAFNPSALQSYLRARGQKMISTQARERLVLPVFSGSPIWSDNPWLQAWQSSEFSHALTPMKTFLASDGNAGLITASQALSLDAAALARLGKRFGVNQILLVETAPGQGSANVTDIALDTGLRRNIGSVRVQDGSDSYSALARSVVHALETDWKRSAVSNAENAVTTTVTVLYGSHMEWQNLQKAIDGSAQIQDARLDVLSKDGALMTLTYGGDINRLRNELSFKGVDVRTDPALGLVLSRAGRF